MSLAFQNSISTVYTYKRNFRSVNESVLLSEMVSNFYRTHGSENLAESVQNKVLMNLKLRNLYFRQIVEILIETSLKIAWKIQRFYVNG